MSRAVLETNHVERNPSVDDLLGRWQSLRADQKPATVEDLCTDCPEQTTELRERLRAVASMMSFLGLKAGSGPNDSISTEDSVSANPNPTLVAEHPGDGVDAAGLARLVQIPGY